MLFRSGKVARLPLAKASAILAESSIVGHDTKEFLKALLGAGCQQLPIVKHDTAQGSFLLNPLRKSRELADNFLPDEPRFVVS